MNYRNVTLLCTGFSGFIGTNLYLRLGPKGARFIALVPPYETPRTWADAIIYNGLVEDHALLNHIFRSHRIDYVLHFAANAIVQHASQAPFETFETNVRGTWNLLEAMRQHGSAVRGVICASTDKIYGEGNPRPWLETDALDPCNIYDISKACGDMIARGYSRNYNIPLMVARFCNVYGERDANHTRIVPRTLRLLHENRPPVVNMHCDSNGKMLPFRRDFIYIEDILDGLELMIYALSQGKHVGNAFNFGTESCHEISDVVRLICHEAGFDFCPTFNEVCTGELLTQCMSFRKAQQLLGFTPRYTLAEGIARTVRWYREEALA